MRIETTPHKIGNDAIAYSAHNGVALYRVATETEPGQCVSVADARDIVAAHGEAAIYCGGRPVPPEYERDITLTLSVANAYRILTALRCHATNMRGMSKRHMRDVDEEGATAYDIAEALKEADIFAQLARASDALCEAMAPAIVE